MNRTASPASTETSDRVGPFARVGRAFRRGLANSGIEQLNMRWRFRLVVLAFGLPFLAYIVWSATQQAMLEKEQVSERTRASATLVATRFEDHIQQVDRLLATMAQTLNGRLDDAPAVNNLFQSMRSYMPKTVDNIGLWSLDGRNIAALDRRSATRAVNVADRKYFRDAISHRELTFEGPIASRSTGVAIIQFARPVFNADNELIAVITMSDRSAELIGALDPRHAITSRALVTIIDDQGTIVMRSAEPELWIGKQIADLHILKAAFAQRNGAQEEVGVDGRNLLAGYSVVANRPWIVIVGEPIEQVTGPIARSLLGNLAIGLVILFLALVVAGRVASWTLSPLVQLASDAERLGDGDLSHRSEVATGGEIATLAANFNRMARAVEERDAALKRSRQEVQEIVSHFPGQVTFIDREERYRFINRFVPRLSSLPPETMLGKSMLEVRGEVVYRTISPSLHRALAGEASSVALTRTEHDDVVHLLVEFVPLRDHDGSVAGVYAFTQDVTEQKRAELLLAESRKRLLTITNNVPAMICYVDEQRRFRFANSAFENWFKRPLSEIVGQTMDQLMVPEIAAKYERSFGRCLQGETVDFELEVPSFTHGPRWLKGTLIPDFDEETGKVCGVYGLIHNATKAKIAEQNLIRLAQFDTLTGLANRNQFNEILARVCAAGHDDGARDGAPDTARCALMFLDIDHFKLINDRHGHASGDLLLKEFAQRLAGCVRPSDAVARLSGDEFVVLLQDMHSDEPQFVARKIIAAIEKPFVLDDQVMGVTASIGIAVRAHADESPSAIMKRADEALYEAKRAGRNTFRLAG